MEKKSNGTLIGLLIGIIIMLLVIVILFATGTIKFKSTTTNNNKQISDNNKNDKLNNIYLEFINKKEYSVEDILKEYNKLSYVIYDIDDNGIDELLIRFTHDNDINSEWDYTSIYTYVNNEIKLIKTIYAWTGIQLQTGLMAQ